MNGEVLSCHWYVLMRSSVNAKSYRLSQAPPIIFWTTWTRTSNAESVAILIVTSAQTLEIMSEMITTQPLGWVRKGNERKESKKSPWSAMTYVEQTNDAFWAHGLDLKNRPAWYKCTAGLLKTSRFPSVRSWRVRQHICIISLFPGTWSLVVHNCLQRR